MITKGQFHRLELFFIVQKIKIEYRFSADRLSRHSPNVQYLKLKLSEESEDTMPAVTQEDFLARSINRMHTHTQK